MPTVTLTPSADTYINAATADNNFSGGGELNAGVFNANTFHTLLNFDLSGIPGTATIQTATLTLYRAGGNGATTLYTARITSSWTETGVTWNSRPTTTGQQLAGTTPSTTGVTWSLDVKTHVQAAVNGNPFAGIALYPQGGSTYSMFWPKENGTASNRPSLSITYTTNRAPNAPILTAPANGATIDRTSVQRFVLTPSDPDAGDSTAQTWWRYRLISAPTWTTVTQTSPLTYIDFAAGTFAAGDYEWQAATRDAQGAPTLDADLKWSTSSFFTAATAPPAPTITAPINGGTVSNVQDVAWSAPSQGAYQLRRVRDNAGTADTATVYYDSGEVVSTTARSRTVTFETNNRYEHVQVRIKVGGLWSSWASVRVNVSYTPPTTPVVTLTPEAATGSLLVGITNPAPGAGVPATAYNDVYVDDGNGEERRATMLAPNTAWRYWTPKSGRDYVGRVRVVAVATNGTTASS